MLTNTLKIWDTTKTEFFELIFFLNDQKIRQKFSRARFKQCFGPFNMLAVHKCSDTGLFRHFNNPVFCSLKFQKQITSEDHLLYQSIPNFRQISEMAEKVPIIFFDFAVIAFELVALDTPFYWENTCHWVSIC